MTRNSVTRKIVVDQSRYPCCPLSYRQHHILVLCACPLWLRRRRNVIQSRYPSCPLSYFFCVDFLLCLLRFAFFSFLLLPPLRCPLGRPVFANGAARARNGILHHKSNIDSSTKRNGRCLPHGDRTPIRRSQYGAIPCTLAACLACLGIMLCFGATHHRAQSTEQPG